MARVKAVALRARTRLRRRQLNRRIAWGAEGPYDPHRALQQLRLREMPERERLASALERVLEASRQPIRLSSAAPIDRRAVRIAKPIVEELIHSLRSADDVDPQGVALGWCLLTDADGPLYATPASSGDLRSLSYAALSSLIGLRALPRAEPSRPRVMLP